MKWVFWIDAQVSSVPSTNLSTGALWMDTVCYPPPILHSADSRCLLCPCFLSSLLLSTASIFLPSLHLSVSRTYVKRSLAMRPDRGGGRKISSSLSWPRCCLCPGPSPASWTRPRSYGWPSATCTCAPLPARETRPGAPWGRETATAAKVRKKGNIKDRCRERQVDHVTEFGSHLYQGCSVRVYRFICRQTTSPRHEAH